MSARRRWALDRRTLLRGAGSVALGLPLLDAMPLPRRASAAAGVSKSGAPLRIIFVYTAQGVARPEWDPSGGETDFKLNISHKPLEPWRDKLILIDGLPNKAAGPMGGHGFAANTSLTGYPLVESTTEGFQDTGGRTTRFSQKGAESIDNALAKLLGGKPPLVVAADAGHSGILASVSFNGPNRANANETDPQRLFERLFGSGVPSGSSSEIRLLRERKRSILDNVKADYAALCRKLGKDDCARLDIHLAGIREIENTLDAVTAGPVCTKPDGKYPAKGDISGSSYAAMPDLFRNITRAMLDLSVAALACDQARVVTQVLEESAGGRTFSWLNHTRGHHDMSHNSTDFDRRQIAEIDAWWAGQLAYMAGKMAGYPELDGTLLEHSCILWVHELSLGDPHLHTNTPWVLLGGLGGALRTGRFLRFPDRAQNDLFVSLLRAVGSDATTFGKAELNRGPLDLS